MRSIRNENEGKKFATKFIQIFFCKYFMVIFVCIYHCAFVSVGRRLFQNRFYACNSFDTPRFGTFDTRKITKTVASATMHRST